MKGSRVIMSYDWILNKTQKEEPILQEGNGQGWSSLRWLGGAILVLTVPGGLVLWLGREVVKRGAFSTESGWVWTSRNWINRKLTWTMPSVEKIAP